MASRPAAVVRRALTGSAGGISVGTKRYSCAASSRQTRSHQAGPSAQIRHRCLSHSAPGPSALKSFFSPERSARLPTVSAVDDPHVDFLAAISSTHIISLRKAYDALLQQASQASATASSSSAPSDTLRPGEIMSAMTFLSGRAEPHALGLLKRIYADLPQWGIIREKKHYRAVLRGMCTAGQVAEALDWIQQYAEHMDADIWRIVLRAAVRHQPDLVPDAEAGLRGALGEKGLTGNDYALLLRHMRVQMPEEQRARQRIRELLGESKKRGVWIGRDAEAELVAIHLAMGDLDRAGELVSNWDTGVVGGSASEADVAVSKVVSPTLWNTTIDYLIAREDVQGVKTAMAHMQRAELAPYDKGMGLLVVRGVKDLRGAPTGSTSTALPTRSAILDVFDTIENDVGVKASSVTWADVLDLFAVKDLRLTQELYDEARARGVFVESHIAKALIFPLCARQPPDLRSAMDVYADLTSQSVVITTSSVRSRLLAIYSELLRAYARSPSADSGIPARLLKDMRRFGLSLPTSALTSIIVSLMNTSPDHITAFNNYAHLYALNPSALDAKAYSVIISAFIGYTTPSSPFAPSALVLEFIKDMRKAGFVVSPQILTALLASYAAQAGGSRRTGDDPVYRQAKLDSITKAISNIHNMLKLESIVEPDVPLLNALMDAYSRVGAYSSSFEVWDQLVERRVSEPKETVQAAYGPSVSIILDTCGWAGQAQRAKRIWGWAKRHNLDGPGMKAWEGWVECLCRLGKMDEAADMLIARETKDGVVNVEMLRVLLKFCWSDKGAYRRIPPRIQEAFPDMWEQVKEVVETRTVRDQAEEI